MTDWLIVGWMIGYLSSLQFNILSLAQNYKYRGEDDEDEN
jgi:hypothetical protein